jgi:hypothetical protein
MSISVDASVERTRGSCNKGDSIQKLSFEADAGNGFLDVDAMNQNEKDESMGHVAHIGETVAVGGHCRWCRVTSCVRGKNPFYFIPAGISHAVSDWSTPSVPPHSLDCD